MRRKSWAFGKRNIPIFLSRAKYAEKIQSAGREGLRAKTHRFCRQREKAADLRFAADSDGTRCQAIILWPAKKMARLFWKEQARVMASDYASAVRRFWRANLPIFAKYLFTIFRRRRSSLSIRVRLPCAKAGFGGALVSPCSNKRLAN